MNNNVLVTPYDKIHNTEQHDVTRFFKMHNLKFAEPSTNRYFIVFCSVDPLLRSYYIETETIFTSYVLDYSVTDLSLSKPKLWTLSTQEHYTWFENELKGHTLIAHGGSHHFKLLHTKMEFPEAKLKCTVSLIPWKLFEIHSSVLEIISMYHGILGHRTPVSQIQQLYMLLAYKYQQYIDAPVIRVAAWQADISKKDFLRNRGYRWDGVSWNLDIPYDEELLTSEREFLTKNIYVNQEYTAGFEILEQ